MSGFSATRLGSIVACLLFFFSSTGHAQQLVVNGEFDSDLAGWRIFVGGTPPVWAAFDHADAISGSVLLANNDAAADIYAIGLMQCVVPTQPGRYELQGHGYVLAGGSDGALFIQVSVQPSTTCNGIGGGPGFFLSSIGAWSQFGTHVDISADDIAAGVSILIEIGMRKFQAGGSVQGYIDAVRLIPDSVFANDFEVPTSAPIAVPAADHDF